MSIDLYSFKSNLVLGFHGCDKSVADDVISGRSELESSNNDYDWLGNGIYFWQNDLERALNWAKESTKRPKSKIKTPAVIGAIIDLGYCLDLVDNRYLQELKKSYIALKHICEETGTQLPENKTIGNSNDLLLRKLDCSVIMTAHKLNLIANDKPYDSVRGVFWEGDELYPNAGFAEKNHVQICVCNPNCIKGYFNPREFNSKFVNP